MSFSSTSCSHLGGVPSVTFKMREIAHTLHLWGQQRCHEYIVHTEHKSVRPNTRDASGCPLHYGSERADTDIEQRLEEALSHRRAVTKVFWSSIGCKGAHLTVQTLPVSKLVGHQTLDSVWVKATTIKAVCWRSLESSFRSKIYSDAQILIYDI